MQELYSVYGDHVEDHLESIKMYKKALAIKDSLQIRGKIGDLYMNNDQIEKATLVYQAAVTVFNQNTNVKPCSVEDCQAMSEIHMNLSDIYRE